MDVDVSPKSEEASLPGAPVELPYGETVAAVVSARQRDTDFNGDLQEPLPRTPSSTDAIFDQGTESARTVVDELAARRERDAARHRLVGAFPVPVDHREHSVRRFNDTSSADADEDLAARVDSSRTDDVKIAGRREQLGASPGSSVHHGGDNFTAVNLGAREIGRAPTPQNIISSHLLNRDAKDFVPRAERSAREPFNLNPNAQQFHPARSGNQFRPLGEGARHLFHVAPPSGDPRARQVSPDFFSTSNYQFRPLGEGPRPWSCESRAPQVTPRLLQYQFRPLGEGANPLLDAAPWSSEPRVPKVTTGVRVSQYSTQFRPLGDNARHLFDAGPQRQVRSVWRHNFSAELEYLSSLLNQGRPTIIGFDTEYAGPAPPVEEKGPPQSAGEWYYRLRSLVNSGDVIQLGIVLLFDEVPTVGPYIWEINIYFDPSHGPYNPKTLEFLKKSGHLLVRHTRDGVMAASVAGWIRSNLDPLTAATWVFFQGDYDAAFLLKSFALEQYQLPMNRLEFLQTLRGALPRYYDVRVIGLRLLGMQESGFSLNKLGTGLGIGRLGRAHGSASDALLTLDSFVHIRRTYGDQVHLFVGILCGLFATEDLVRSAISIYAENTELVEVWMHNLNEQASFVLNSVDSNYAIIGLHATFHPFMEFNESKDYTGLRTSVNKVVTGSFSFAMGSIDGQLAGGRICSFNVSFGGELEPVSEGNAYIPANLFAARIMAHLSGNTRIRWITFRGAESIGCVCRSFEPLPPSSREYIISRSAIFPSLFDLAVLAKPDNSSLEKVCQGLSVRLEKRSGERENHALLIVRCVLRIFQCSQSSEIEKNRGYLLPGGCRGSGVPH